MGLVIAEFTLSLDGFIAEPNGDVGRLFGWYYNGDTDLPVPGTPMVFKTSRASAEFVQEAWAAIGAIVTGRGDFDVSQAWGGQPPFGVPMFIVTHAPPQEWLKEGSLFTFVTDGVESALAQARKAAGDKNVAVSGSTIVQQSLNAGLIDELQIDLAPILLGAGVRLFDNLGPAPLDLAITRVIDTPSVTHLTYRVIK